LKNIKRIAVWSGPRNLSTALMRSFGTRNDFEILDEPFYAAYLKKTGIQHPMFDKIISSQLSNYKEVADYCINGQVDKPYQYQKHMTHHMIKKNYKDFVLSLNNVILIRKPELVLNSYKKKNKNYEFKDLGFQQLYDIYEFIYNRLGYFPLIIDADDLQNNPELTLRKLCNCLGIPFFASMLNWSSGSKKYDGIWGVHWYEEINKTTGFSKSTSDNINKINKKISQKDKNIIERANRIYLKILENKI